MARRNKPQRDPACAVVYLRVSTDDQALGPEAQLASIERWALGNGVSIAGVNRDIGVSGGTELADRPALMAALQSLDEHRAGVLLVAKRDRLARDVLVAAAIERLVAAKDARIVSADGTGNSDGPEGMLMRGLVDLFAQYERALVRSRTSAALAVKKQRGERVGQIPLGYQVALGGRLIEDEEEQATLARIAALRADGFSHRGIAVALNADGTRSRGKRWHPTTVARLLEAGRSRCA